MYSREKLLLQQQQQGVCHTVALPLFTLKTLSILRQKKNYGKSSNIFTMPKIIIFQKKKKSSNRKKIKILQGIIITL